MATCPKCGREIEREGHHVCKACSQKHEAIRGGGGGICWQKKIPLVANSLIWRDFIIALAIPIAIIAVIILVFSNAPDRLAILAFFGAVFILFLFIALASMIALSRSLGGGLAATFTVNNAGVGYEAGHPAHAISRRTLALSFILGLVRPAGTHLQAIAQPENFIAWRDVSGVRIYYHQRVILVKNIEMIPPIALYCTPENFFEITTLIGRHVPQAAIS